MSLPHAGAAGAEPDGPTADGRLQSLARAAKARLRAEIERRQRAAEQARALEQDAGE